MKSFIFVLIVSVVRGLPDPVLVGKLSSWTDECILPESENHLDHLDNIEENIPDCEPENFFDPETDVHFLLFTRMNPTKQQTIIRNDAKSLANSHFNPTHPIRLIIHGWRNTPSDSSTSLIRDAYLQSGRFNVFIVDWSAGAGCLNYLYSKRRVEPTGVVVGDFIHFLINSGGVFASQIVLVGFSLGAHVASFAGKNHTSPQLAGIVGLDPAKPGFPADDPTKRLTTTDATYVQVIHTNAGVLGFDIPIGHVDFYPNWGGRRQSGCKGVKLDCCSHSRSYQYFAESINVIANTHFYAVHCPDGYTQIADRSCPQKGATAVKGGEPLNTNLRGVYWLPTKEETPFAMGCI